MPPAVPVVLKVRRGPSDSLRSQGRRGRSWSNLPPFSEAVLRGVGSGAREPVQPMGTESAHDEHAGHEKTCLVFESGFVGSLLCFDAVRSIGISLGDQVHAYVMKVVYFFRKPTPHFSTSIEISFEAFRAYLPSDVTAERAVCRYPSRGLWGRAADALGAIFRQGDVTHITGGRPLRQLFPASGRLS